MIDLTISDSERIRRENQSRKNTTLTTPFISLVMAVCDKWGVSRKEDSEDDY